MWTPALLTTSSTIGAWAAMRSAACWIEATPHPPTPGGGAPRTVADRACMAAILFLARTSTPWALLPVGEFGCGSVTTC